MNHDLLHIQGKPYVLVPLHEYRTMQSDNDNRDELPDELLDAIFARQEHPVKILRQFRQMTQADLADKAGISRPYITEIETGKKEGTIATLRDIATALDVPLPYIVS